MCFLGYTDPGTGMLIWQLLAAGGIGLVFYSKKIWKRIASFFKKDSKDSKE